MGTDITAVTLLGIEVTVDDFFEEVAQAVVVCDHEVGPSDRFCATCGTPVSARRVTRIGFQSKPWCAPVLGADEPLSTRKEAAYALDDEKGANFDRVLTLQVLRGSWRSPECRWVLGVVVGTSESDRMGGAPSAKPFIEVLALLKDLERSLRRIGLADRTIQCLTLMNVSI